MATRSRQTPSKGIQDYSAFVGTHAVSAHHRFDVDALATWLREHIDDFEGPMTVEQFAGGQSNPTFKLVTLNAIT